MPPEGDRATIIPSTPRTADRLIGISDLALLGGLTRQRLHQLAQAGELPTTRVDGQLFVTLADARTWLVSRGVR